jgi:quinoprotein glucose dehydrogenase
MRFSPTLMIPLAAALCLLAAPARPAADADWPNVGNDRGGTRYSKLAQINRNNVRDLKVAWTYRTGDAGRRTTIECTPIVIDGVMYVSTANPRPKVVALDAATGKEVWKYDPYATPRRMPIASGGVNRGVAFWSDGRAEGQRRVIHATADGRLISLDARTGTPDPSFGSGGVVELREGIEADLSRTPYGCTSAPAISRDTVILGFSVSEGPPPGAPGDVRAFDARTGKQVWRFRTVPRPGEFGHDTWPPDAWRGRSGVNPWGGLTVDEERGIVFGGTGSAAYDWYGGDRKGDNLFANCALALDAKTGKRIWHFQTVRHDIWDYDNPCPPVMVTVNHNGRRIDAAAMVTKTGYCYLFDRVTGKPLFDVVDRPAAAAEVPGEELARTQPFPVKPPPLAPQRFTEADVTDISPEARAEALERFRKLRTGDTYIPSTLGGSLATPGFHGGATWSGASFDPATGYLFVNTNNTPIVITLRKSDHPTVGYELFGSQDASRSRTGRGLDVYYFTDKDGYPGVKPPWGMLTAINLNTGDFAWQVPLGEYPELTAKGVPRTGTENFGGTIVTAGGLVFIGGAQDERLHAFDSATGKLLWEAQLPAGGYATPCTYMVNGRQYVVIAAGGGGKLGTRTSDQFVAFALPQGAR